MNDTRQIEDAINGLAESDTFTLHGNPDILIEFDELFAKIQSICKCYNLFEKLLIFMPVNDGSCRRNTLILRLFKIFQSKNMQHVWLKYLNPSVRNPIEILELKTKFTDKFKDACTEYIAHNYAVSANKFKKLVNNAKEKKEAEDTRFYKQKFKLQSKASKETVDVAKKRYRKNLISWSMLLDDNDLAANAIIHTSAHTFDGDFETRIVNGATKMHGSVKLPSSKALELGGKAGDVTFEFAQ